MSASSSSSDPTNEAEPRAVILFSHGSLLCGAGAPLDRHAERLRQMPEFDIVEVGYLNYSNPSFEEAVVKVTAAGAASIVVVPFFLAPGYFVTSSLPKMLSQVSSNFPQATFTIAEPIGYDDDLAAAVRKSAYGARPPTRWRDGLDEAGQSCRRRSDCPVFGLSSCLAGDRKSHVMPSRLNTDADFEDLRPSLLVLAHGSPNAEANAPMLEVIQHVRETSAEFRSVQVGYLECNQPSIPDSIDLCMESEPSMIVTVPYFLHMGTHVASDLPDALDEARVRYPNIEFLMGDFIGNMSEVTDVLAKRATTALKHRHKRERP